MARMVTIKAALIGARGLRWAANRIVGRLKTEVEPDEATELTGWLYDRATRYTRPATQQLGLHDFETAALEEHFPDPPANLLVLGCGGGREVIALLQRGYEIVGSDPARNLVEAASEACGDRAMLVVGKVQDAARFNQHAPFDGVIVGWGAWGYVLQASERVEALRCLAALCPAGPVLLSWPHRRTEAVHTGAGADGVPGQWTETTGESWRDNLVVNPGTGFSVKLGIEDIRAEAAKAGFTVAHDGAQTRGYAHVVLVPQG